MNRDKGDLSWGTTDRLVTTDLYVSVIYTSQYQHNGYLPDLRSSLSFDSFYFSPVCQSVSEREERSGS